MNCKKCGFPLVENDLFCKNCGAAVNAQEGQNSVQPATNNQSGPMQQPINNNQNPWPNNYNSTPTPQPQKSNNGKFIIISIAAVAVLIIGIVLGIIFLGDKSNNPSNPNPSNPGSGEIGGGETPSDAKSTYLVKFKGFAFKIPTDLIYDVDSDALYIGDEADTWQAAIEVVNGSFNQLQANKNNLISAYQQAGYGAANVDQKDYGGLNFITVELTHSGQKAILGFTKANSMYVFGTTAYNLDNSFDYNLLSNVAKVLSTAEYSSETNNISGFNRIDMGPVNELAK